MLASSAIRLLAVALAVHGLSLARADESFDAEDVFARWAEQEFGSDALLAYESRAGSLSSAFAVARHWSGDHPRILIDIREPPEFDDVAFLVRLGPGRPEYWWIGSFEKRLPMRPSNPDRKPRPLPGATLEGSLPEHETRVSLLDFRPLASDEMEVRGLGEEVIEGERCRVIEGRPRSRDLGFDRLELAISTRTGVALRARYFRGDREHRRVTVHPRDVRDFGGRLLPGVRRIESPPGQVEAVVTLRNALLDVDLSEDLFTTRGLRRRRFPSF